MSLGCYFTSAGLSFPFSVASVINHKNVVDRCDVDAVDVCANGLNMILLSYDERSMQKIPYVNNHYFSVTLIAIWREAMLTRLDQTFQA